MPVGAVADNATSARDYAEPALDHIRYNYNENGQGRCSHARLDYAASGGRCCGR